MMIYFNVHDSVVLKVTSVSMTSILIRNVVVLESFQVCISQDYLKVKFPNPLLLSSKYLLIFFVTLII